MQFSLFRSGEPGVTYREGTGEWLTCVWSTAVGAVDGLFLVSRYLSGRPRQAGFADLCIEATRIEDTAGMADATELKNYEVERRLAPFMIIHGQRPWTG